MGPCFRRGPFRSRGHTSAFPPFANAGFAKEIPPFRNQRAQGMPDAQPHPRPHVQRKKHMSFSHHRSGRVTGTPCAMFYDLFRALSGDRAFLSPSLAAMREASSPTSRQRRGVKTTRLRRPRLVRSSCAPRASIASRPTSVTIAKRPFDLERDKANHEGDLRRSSMRNACDKLTRRANQR
jgi:hypothetical protein